MASWKDYPELQRWYRSLRPLAVDIIGDFAGKELFAIHGDSLLLYCISEAKVDYKEGFQLLHAVHAVETFLANLNQRGCNFHLLWFHNHEQLSVPTDASEATSACTRLTRAVLIKHLQHHTPERTISFEFSAAGDAAFRQHILQNSFRFFLCLDGAAFDDGLTPLALQHIAFIQYIGSLGYSVALINGFQFKSSKALASVIPPSPGSRQICDEEPLRYPRRPITTLAELQRDARILDQDCSPWGDCAVYSARDVISLTGLCNTLLLHPGTAAKAFASSYVLHLVELRRCSLSQRPCTTVSFDVHERDVLDKFLTTFAETCASIVQSFPTQKQWDVFDLVDGRILRYIFKNLKTISLPSDMADEARIFARRILQLTGIDILETLPTSRFQASASSLTQSSAGQESVTSSVIAFEHKALDKYLQSIHVVPSDSAQPVGAFMVFQELSHWHSLKRLDPKHVPRAKGFFARRKHQKLMADIMQYSASLTNASGNVLKPEIIVKESKPNRLCASGSAPLKPESSGKRRKGGKNDRKNGRESAHETYRKLEKEESDRKAQDSMAAWEKTCHLLQVEEDLSQRFAKAEKYLRGLSDEGLRIIGAEVALYICDILALMILRGRKEGDTTSEMVLFAKIFSTMFEASKMLQSEASLRLVNNFSKALRIPVSETVAVEPLLADRKLPFSSVMTTLKTDFKLPITPIDFQLERCGPFLERSFDPAPDDRVPNFIPDAWQREVLDLIDANSSLFVVAPTSAGKTFISFYAMKKVLKSSNNGIIVYVAPTKALVNQVAAEIQARFSKRYDHAARSVWAIHTRDYRLNDPTGCQVLVTVPHILQIMLLAPSNAINANAWSARIQRIIFDEIHCIGQEEDGVIWEQLLLLAPCPIIALSATVGNPPEFKQWLETSEKTKGHKLEMIIHPSRYSDLRKFLYRSPKNELIITGLKAPSGIPTPGLDDVRMGPFTFIHPVTSLINRNRGTIDDITLEPRDCLTLWRSMLKHQTKEYPVGDDLLPENMLPEVVKRSDVLQWAKHLKETLKAWMEDAQSPFSAVQSELGLSILPPAPESRLEASKAKSEVFGFAVKVSDKNLHSQALPLLIDLHDRRALPAILFNYDRVDCEKTLHLLLEKLTSAEQAWKEFSPQWKKKLAEYKNWEKTHQERKAKNGIDERKNAKNRPQDESMLSKLEMIQQYDKEPSKWDSFDADEPLEMFSFADRTKLPKSDLETLAETLRGVNVDERLVSALERGIAAHHAGLNRQYRQVVEILFRKGFLRVVIATGTLALGINMPCKTVVFFGDSVYLTALNYHQASGRAGRRGFDLLGNVVFVGIPPERVHEIMSSRLPDLRGHFPLSTTLTLRLLGLLHHTKNSEYSVRTMQSILSQSRLYLGGPSDQTAIKHQLRFSIEYLRRQGLLAEDGTPINFAGLIGHLYFTENAVFAFHSLLKEGFFHEVCETIDSDPKRVLLSLVLVLAHLFCRVPLHNANNRFMAGPVKSPSVIKLPPLPEQALSILQNHNRETLNIFRLYVSTFVEQHLSSAPDVKLPLTGYEIQPQARVSSSHLIIDHLPPKKLRSPFSALSGFTDEFKTIHELCTTVRSGVFLEESAVPHIKIHPTDTEIPWNAYIYDFFKHGDMTALVRDNLIKRGDVWFRLRDFSLVLATIATSLENYVNLAGTTDDDAMVYEEDLGDTLVDEQQARPPTPEGGHSESAAAPKVKKAGKGKEKSKPVLDSWEDDTSEDESASSCPAESYQDLKDKSDGGLLVVVKAFRQLRDEFDEKFRKVWA